MLLSLPAFAPYPSPQQRQLISPPEWNTLVDTWVLLADLHIQLPQTELGHVCGSHSSLVIFLATYFEHSILDHASHSLRKPCFLLAHRILLDPAISDPRLSSITFLTDFCRNYLRNRSLGPLLTRLWSAKQSVLSSLVQDIKSSLVSQLSSSSPEMATAEIQRLIPLIHASSEAASAFMIGSDLIDGLCQAYAAVSAQSRQHLVIFAFLGLTSLLKAPTSNHALLIDHLYSIKALSRAPAPSPSLLADLVTNTPLQRDITRFVHGKDAPRAHTLVVSLADFKHSALARPRRPTRRLAASHKVDGTRLSTGQHVHRMSRITQIQELFPDFGSGFVSRLLDEYHDDVELVIAHVLQDSLPEHLATVDRALTLPEPGVDRKQIAQRDIDHLAPRSTPPLPSPSRLPIRRNVFDEEEDLYDILQVDPSRIRFGRSEAANPLEEGPSQPKPSKAAILAALAAFDSDDDERDDTYDDADVGDTIDAAGPTDEHERDTPVSNKEIDTLLFGRYQRDKDVFGRSAEVRRSRARDELKHATNLTDETIEGWALMLARDPKRQLRLARDVQDAGGGQMALERTSYKDGDESEGGAHRANGRGRGGYARGSRDAGSSSARQAKEANKGSRANHNRRDQRARKIAWAGFAG